MFDKLQRGYLWPTVNGLVTPHHELCSPRLALCHAILDSWDWEADAVRMLIALDAFTGLGRFKEPGPVRSRVGWHLAYESTVCRASAVAARVEVWRSGLPAWASEAAARVWSSDGGVASVAEVLATRSSMLIDPPLTYDGWIEEAHVLAEVDAWLGSLI